MKDPDLTTRQRDLMKQQLALQRKELFYMADPAHLRMLKQGVKVWNEWRKKNPHIIPYLKGADLRGENIEGANLEKANLRRARLEGAILKGANLKKADLRGVVLAAEMPSTVVVDLTDADLRMAKFTIEESLVGAGSFLDLSACIGLDSAKFSKPTLLWDYLIKAFEYAHRTDLSERKRWPNFVQHAIQNIKLLQNLYGDKQPPQQLIEVINSITVELIKYLKKHTDALYEIKPRQFEKLIAEILASYGWQVQLTPPVKDGGYDIFAISKDIKANVKTAWIIECKKYAPENKVGLDIVRALYGVKSDLKVANALLATTSYFTKGVVEFKASHYDIELKDYESILEWINEYRPNPDGKLYIRDNKLIMPND